MKAKVLTIVLVLSGLFVAANKSYGWTQPPDAVLEVFPEYVVPGRSVILDASDSSHPNGNISYYKWDFTDNGSYDYCETSSSYPDGVRDWKTTYTFYGTGTYTVKLRVSVLYDLNDVDTATVYVCSDEDADGLPDGWEDVYDLNDANFADADIDSDNDTYSNLCEYLHGSEPDDANSYPSASFNVTIPVPLAVGSIQRAINAAIDGDTILVSKGAYHENIDFEGKEITLTSTDPEDPEVVAATVIDADGSGIVVTFDSSEDANSVLKGFTITGGYAGIYCGATSPTVSNCVIRGNWGLNDNRAHWRMDDDANDATVWDSSGNGYNGMFNDVGGDPNTDAHHTNGIIDGALTFDGSDDYVNCGDLDVGSSFTLSAWVRLDTTGFQGILTKGDTEYPEDISYILYYNDTHTFGIYVSEDGGSTNAAYVETVSTYTETGNWYHVVTTFDGEDLALYVDGTDDSDSQVGSVTGVHDSNVDTLIGPWVYGEDIECPFDGRIDDVMVFDKALTAAEVSVMYHSGGGGVYCIDSASPTITNCIVHHNSARYGGGIFDVNSSPTIASCVFTYNLADVNGGGMCNYDSSPALTNCTFSGNYAYGDGGGMASFGSSGPELINCIIWGNAAAGTGHEVYNAGSADPNFSYCDIEGCGGSGGGWDPNYGSDDGGNIDSDPNFVDAYAPYGQDGLFGTFDDGLQLQYLNLVSPCVDAADGDAAPSTDITGRARSDVNSVSDTGTGTPDYADMGAYECPMVWLVDKDATGSNNGTSWANAFTSLQSALSNTSDGEEIWVAEGTYKPTSGSSRTVSFELVEGVGVYGGFAGAEDYRYERDWTTNSTTLSGDIGTQGSQSDNSYNVVKGANRAVLDGFTITGGNANGSYPNYYGGGIYCYGKAPTVRNCAITGNNASSYGGGIYNYSLHWTGWWAAAPEIQNCIFTDNSASSGGAMYNSASAPVLINCTFSGNAATNYGGAVWQYNSLLTATNCIFWGDSANKGDEIYNYYLTYNYYTGNSTFSHCDIKDSGGSGAWDPNLGNDAGGNIDSDPNFADSDDPDGEDNIFLTFDDGLQLQAVSPCIDAADGYAASVADILAHGRVNISSVSNTGSGIPAYVDMGAYESYLGVDTDGDGIPDVWEVENGLDPYKNDGSQDLDGDGLTNLEEYDKGTDPHDADSDNDYMPDGWEVDNGLNPNSDTGKDGSGGDLDYDDYTNLSEYLHASDPNDGQSEPNSTTTITVPAEVGSIQAAIDLSITSDVIEVLPGTYTENVDFSNKAVTLTGTDPNDWCTVESTIIYGDSGDPVVLFDEGENANSVVTGLTLKSGMYGISCTNSSSPTIMRCIIEECESHGIYCTSGSPEIANCIIADNGDENGGDGIHSSASAPPIITNNWIYWNTRGIEFTSANSAAVVRNNTIVENTNYGIYVSPGTTAPTVTNCIIWDNSDDLYNCSATYSCIQDGDSGTGNISTDPQFIDDPNEDCRLLRSSPCKDAGTGTYTNETDIDGEVRDANGVDMGADEICEVHNNTQDLWYNNIQEAINNASEGDVIEIYEWEFEEAIDFCGTNVTLTSTDPNDWTVIECTIINANDNDANVVRVHSGEDANAVIMGMTLTGGKYGVYCDNSSSPTIKTCCITDNSSAGIACISGSPLITRCKISENSGDGVYSSGTTPPTIKTNWIYRNDANGISLKSAGSVATIRNNTIVSNALFGIDVLSGTEPNVSNCIIWGHESDDLSGVGATYSCIEDVNDANGAGNITGDPRFRNSDSNDYYLRSDSPCIDASDPNADYTGDVELFGLSLESPKGSGVDIGGSEDPVYFVNKDATNSGGDDEGNPTYETWDTAFTTLQDALLYSDLHSGDSIWVRAGTYKPDESAIANVQPSQSNAFALVEGVILMGGFAGHETPGTFDPDQRKWRAHPTVLSGDIGKESDNSDNSYHVVVAEDADITKLTVLDGFMITGGRAFNPIAQGSGDYELQSGGGIRIMGCSPTISNCTFEGNHAKRYGGGMAILGFGYGPSSPAVISCSFIDNVADGEFSSGQVGNGGALWSWVASPNTTIQDCTFEGNSARYKGNAVHVSSGGPVKFEHCVFANNKYNESYGAWYGGGIYIGSCDTRIAHCLFVGNECIRDGGGVSSWYSKTDIVNCTFVQNQAWWYRGGAVFHIGDLEDDIMTLTNCILWDNPADETIDHEPPYSHEHPGIAIDYGVTCNPPLISHCCIEDCFIGEEWDDRLGDDQGGNKDDNPAFVDYADPLGTDRVYGTDRLFGTYDDGLRLASDSPCIDTGDGSDYSNEPFGGGGCINMGAYGNTTAAAHKDYWIGCIDLDVDADRDGSVESGVADEVGEDGWSKGQAPTDDSYVGKGALVLPNCDDDDQDGIPDNWTGLNTKWYYGVLGDWDIDGTYEEDKEKNNNWIDGDEDEKDLAKLYIYELDCPEAELPQHLKITLKVKEVPGEHEWFFDYSKQEPFVPAKDRIRIFKTDLNDGKAIIGPGASDIVEFVADPAYPPHDPPQYDYDMFNDTGVSGKKLEFLVEGIEVGAMVDIVLTLEDTQNGIELGEDRVRIKVAPFVMSDHSMKIDRSGDYGKTVYVVKAGEDSDPPQSTNNVELRKNKLRPVYTTDLLDEVWGADGIYSGDPWHQDGYEVGYVKVPYGDTGPTSMPVFLVSPRAKRDTWQVTDILLKYVHRERLAPNVGVWGGLEFISYGNEYDSCGNLESRPRFRLEQGTNEPVPVPGDFFYGKDLSSDMKLFFDAQGVNALLPVDTSWLWVGHVDEVISFAPDRVHTVVADPNLCWALLLWADSISPDGEILVGGDEMRTVRDILTDSSIRWYTFESTWAKVRLPGIRTDLNLSSPETIPVGTGSLGGKLLAGGAFLGFFDDGAPKRKYVITFNTSTIYSLKYRDWSDAAGDWGSPYTEGHAYSISGSIDTNQDCIFKDAKCFIFKHWWEGTFQNGDTFEFEAHPDCKTIEMPVLFNHNDGSATAYNVDHVNCMVDGDGDVVGDTVFTATTHEVGTTNKVIDYVKVAFKKAGFAEVRDADSRYYHGPGGGNIHCGTNTLRERPTYYWWDFE